MSNHHVIDYIELTMRDIAEATEFYTAAFGWQFTAYGPNYVGIQGEGKEAGGFTKGDPMPRGGALVVLYSDDLEASVEAVKSAGGAVVTPPFDFPGGRRFHFTDPSGNELAVWTKS